MKTTALNHINSKLKNLPEPLLEEVEKYIDLLTCKHNQDIQEIPQWQQELVIKRKKENRTPVDAFEMIEELLKE